MSHDWMPRGRDEVLAMAKNWCILTDKNSAAWGVPLNTVLKLDQDTDTAGPALEKTKNPDKSAVDTARCKEAFDTLEEEMRDIKKRYFLQPPLSDSDMVELGLKPRDTTRTTVAVPAGQAEADVSYPGPHLLELHIKPLSGTDIDPKADYGFRIYYGVLPPGGASVTDATGQGRYLMKAAVSGEDLPHSKFVRKHKELFDFPAEDSGSTVFFCIRFENSKGEAGPWGPVFQAVIP
jgi:hypothetical protein